MSGDFYYPIVPLYVNVNDKVEVSWWSTFAKRLQFWCYENDNNPDLGYIYEYDIPQNGTQDLSLPMLEQDVKDWSEPVECGIKFYERGGTTTIYASSVTISSVATQPASIFALSSTVTYERTTTSAPASGTASTPANTGNTAPPTVTPTNPVVTTTSSDSAGLSTGAKAGIGAGIGVSALLVAAAAYLFYRNHRKLKDLNARLSYQSQAEQFNKPPGVAVAPHGSNGNERPYSEATMSQIHSSPQVPVQLS
ncbi:uncharacterized protein J4E79_010604 [Alternaria viburni]|uniref:uncharacterized protein n=1 Tax=Alternaria viburni TaxID=566460 RepID=UPI0020C33FCB|nr:uncharacterized protein J4E79_010604 [Alternaria viburni]KAI4646096.1 hypothetical protein J4E79_010604 [Alternaria viburni]